MDHFSLFPTPLTVYDFVVTFVGISYVNLFRRRVAAMA